MKPNIMVCVTQQKSCKKLIDIGASLAKKTNANLHVIHVVKEDWKYFGTLSEPEALDYLFNEANKNDADLIVSKSKNIEFALKDAIESKEVDLVILGKTSETTHTQNIIERLKNILAKDISLKIVNTKQK